MSIALWVAQVILALAFLGAGAMKLTKSKEELAENGMGFVEDFSPGAVRGIGAVEVLGALGLLLPALTGILPVLTPIAAAGLVITMLVAAAVHIRRGEQSDVIKNVVLGAIAVFIAWGRFGPYAF